MHQNPYDDDDLYEDDDFVSKSELKRQMHEMQDFAMKLLTMTKHQRSQLPLTDELQQAMIVADKIRNKPEALRRHARYVCKVLLEMDLAPIHQALDKLANRHQQTSLLHEKYQQFRDELLSYDNQQLEQLINDFELLERQKLRQLIRQCNKELKAEKPAKYHQELVQYLKLAKVLEQD